MIKLVSLQPCLARSIIKHTAHSAKYKQETKPTQETKILEPTRSNNTIYSLFTPITNLILSVLGIASTACPNQEKTVQTNSTETNTNEKDKYFEQQLQEFKALTEELQILETLKSLLDWDLQTYIPAKGTSGRAWQMSYLSRQYHEILASDKMHNLLEYLRTDSNFRKLNQTEQALVKFMRKQHDKAKLTPINLVQELAETTSQAHHVWVNARTNNNFNQFAPYLEKIFSLKRQTAKQVGYLGSPYNALLDMYEPEITTEQLDKLFAELKNSLVPLIRAIKSSPEKIDNSCLRIKFSEDELKFISKQILEMIGFDFSCGRLDESAHPFSTIVGDNDTRITTRYRDFWYAASAATHEGGHGLYDQGIDPSLVRTPLADGVSLGIHESQSRLYEAIIGQGLPFWKYYFPKLQEKFPERLKGITLEQFYKAINKVQAIPIRNESDEVTYNLHVIVRYEIEKDLIEGKIQVKDIPKVWNDKTEDYLGIRPKNDSEGCLQDVHWACGDVGYFPSYTLGNLYAAQIYNKAKEEIPDLEEQIANGNLMLLREWLREKIHKYGRMETPNEVIQRVTGEPLNVRYFIDYLRKKYSKIYNIKL